MSFPFIVCDQFFQNSDLEFLISAVRLFQSFMQFRKKSIFERFCSEQKGFNNRDWHWSENMIYLRRGNLNVSRDNWLGNRPFTNFSKNINWLHQRLLISKCNPSSS